MAALEEEINIIREGEPGYTDIIKVNSSVRAEEFYPLEEDILEIDLDTETREIILKIHWMVTLFIRI